MGAHIGSLPACNGWEHWYYETDQGNLVVIDSLREKLRKTQKTNSSSEQANIPHDG
jgi:hypothetical protein